MAIRDDSTDQQWTDGHWQTADGLQLHYRDYPGRDDRPPILCIPGLTRNARDFEPVADAFAGEWRVLVSELRGRGDSDYAKDATTYNPEQYVADIEALLDHLALDRVVAIGTSLGGMVAMLLAAQAPARFAGIALNDIGPVVEEAGLERIRDYVGHGRSYPTWIHAAWSLRESAGGAYPDYAISDWLTLAKRLMCIAGNGRITFDYDMKIAEPFARQEDIAPVDLWPVFRTLANDRPGFPLLVLRGELSDILSPATMAQMQRESPGLDAVTVPRIGHAPTLEEPVAQEAIARLLAKVA